jgi:phage head maturation protease
LKSLEVKMKHETRALREAPALDSKRTLAGYAAVFNSEADIGGYFREVIAPGAFADTLKEADVRALVDHDSGRLIGRKSNGTAEGGD